jgi:hypothetical protein
VTDWQEDERVACQACQPLALLCRGNRHPSDVLA